MTQLCLWAALIIYLRTVTAPGTLMKAICRLLANAKPDAEYQYIAKCYFPRSKNLQENSLLQNGITNNMKYK